MDEEKILREIVGIIKNKGANEELINLIDQDIREGYYNNALKKIESFLDEPDNEDKIANVQNNEEEVYNETIDINNEEESIYPEKLRNRELEKDFVGMLLNDPKLMSKYYILFEENYFENKILLEIYKGIVFTEGEAFTPYIAKKGYNFGKIDFVINNAKKALKSEYKNKELDMDKVYSELKKLFILRKNYLAIPIKSVQDSIEKITEYELYSKMSEQEVKNAINQVLVTNKFKQTILSKDLTNFFIKGENNLINGLALPFRILSDVFKGIRKGELMSFAMPSNAGKSRLTVNLASYVAFIHNQKVLVISNEMSEEKMKLCLITTVLNNKAYQNLHGVNITKTEGELLNFQFRPDNLESCKVDEEGFVLKNENETQEQFAKRLEGISEEFRKTLKVTDWVNTQIKNSIYFVNITDHTNDELQKIIMNYYYKYNIHYMFYDTLKTDTANIGNAEEIKKTATILSNLAQNFGLFIFSTLQLTENSTLPINLDINDLSVSRTVKEVLDTLCLAKQINNEQIAEYEYSEKEVGTKYYNLEKSEDPDVRYYACVVDKNRAGAKPKVLLKLNLAYNYWEELGFLRLKQE